MRTYLIRKDRLGNWQYSENKYNGWFYFPDYVRTRADMVEFFKTGGRSGWPQRFDDSDIQFVDFNGNPVVNYSVKRNGEFVSAKVNHDKTLLFTETDFMNVQEQTDFLKEFSDPETISEGDQIENDREKLHFFKSNSDVQVMAKLQDAIEERKNDENIIKLCRAHSAKCYNLPANVEILE